MTDSMPASMAGAVDLSSLGGPRSEEGHGQQGAPSLVVDISEADFEQILQVSARVPVLVDLRASWSEESTQLTQVLEKLVKEYGGRLVLAKVDADTSPQIVQAFQAQTIPTVVALIGGRPAPLFQGAAPEEQIRQVLDQVLQLAAQQGVDGTIDVGNGAEEPAAEQPLPPLHQEAFDALQRGDLPGARDAYERAIKESPSDDDALAGLAQVGLLERLEGRTRDAIRADAAQDPSSVDAQLAVADLDVSGGHVTDAFDRLLTMFPAAGDDKDRIRERLLELFLMVGHDDERVIAARRRLTMLLY